MGLRGQARRPGPERRARLRPPGPHPRRAGRGWGARRGCETTARTTRNRAMTRRRKSVLPEWWTWALVLSDHVERRMEDRGFSEVDLRTMITRARSYRPSGVEG